MSLNRDLRQGQIRIADQATAEMLALFGALDFKAIDASSPALIEAAVSVAERRHSEAVGLGSDMYLSMRRDAGVHGAFTTHRPALDTHQLRRDLVIIGPVAAKKLLSRGVRIPDAARRIFVAMSGRVARNALSGARDTITGSAVIDTQAYAYARVPRGDACGWCQMLAENTYKEAFSAQFAYGGRKRARRPQPMGAKFHDHCRCVIEGLFHGGPLPEAIQRKRDIADAWREASKAGLSYEQFVELVGEEFGLSLNY